MCDKLYLIKIQEQIDKCNPEPTAQIGDLDDIDSDASTSDSD